MGGWHILAYFISHVKWELGTQILGRRKLTKQFLAQIYYQTFNVQASQGEYKWMHETCQVLIMSENKCHPEFHPKLSNECTRGE